MAKLIPDAKLIVQLRNPVDRAYSQFHMRRRDNEEPFESFAEALEHEDPSFGGRPAAPDPGEWRTYLKRGLYAEQLERWLRYFPREQVHVLSMEDLEAGAEAAMDDLHRFLGLPPFRAERLDPRFVTEYEPMPADTRSRLLEYFRPHNERLANLLGRDFGWSE
jgi:hypothetical protein